SVEHCDAIGRRSVLIIEWNDTPRRKVFGTKEIRGSGVFSGEESVFCQEGRKDRRNKNRGRHEASKKQPAQHEERLRSVKKIANLPKTAGCIGRKPKMTKSVPRVFSHEWQQKNV
ncbi:MAG: hypothetical protein DWI13_04225, partial [Planctomycetota bacterium]